MNQLFDRNKQWAANIKKEDPDFFSQLSEGQNPDYLWIGCSDSRVPPTQLTDLGPGDLFVHRNIANMVVHSDLNSLSVLQYAVEALEVKHIIVCGHYGCGGVKASMEEEPHGLIDNWLLHIKDVGRLHTNKLNNLNDNEKHDLLCELNVAEQVKNVCSTPIVKNAWVNGADLTVHGLIYSLEDGFLQNLNLSASSLKEAKSL